MSDASNEQRFGGTTSRAETQFLLVGRYDRDLIAPLLRADPRVCSARDTHEALKLVSDCKADPSHLLFFQDRPGQIPWEDARRLIELMPLTRVMIVLGGWCEGETRTGSPWPGIQRLYWHQLHDSLEQILVSRSDSQRDTQGVCRTWTDADASLSLAHGNGFDSTATGTREGHRGMLAIRARERETFEAFAGWVEELEYSSVWLPCHGPHSQIPAMTSPTGCLWFGDTTRASEREDLRALSERLSDIPMIALLHFPRQRDVRAARRLGADHVVSLPCWGEGLTRAIGRVLNKQYSLDVP